MKQISLDQMEGIIWHNKELIANVDAKAHLLNYTLQYGYGVFEGIRFYNGKIFKLEEHIDRLIASALMINIEMPYSKQEIMKACVDVIDKQKLINGYLRPFIWLGADNWMIASQNIVNITIAGVEREGEYYSDITLKNAMSLKTSKWRKASHESLPVQSKATGLYLMNTIYKKEAIAANYDDCLLLDYRGYVAESSTSNIFFIFDNELHTPIADCFLNGITRQTIIDLAKKRNIKVVERHILPEEILQAQGVFLTGTAMEVTSVKQIDNQYFTIDELTKILANDYYNLVHDII